MLVLPFSILNNNNNNNNMHAFFTGLMQALRWDIIRFFHAPLAVHAVKPVPVIPLIMMPLSCVILVHYPQFLEQINLDATD